MNIKNILLLTLTLLTHTLLVGQDEDAPILERGGYELSCDSDFSITECIGPTFTNSEGEIFSKVTATITNRYFNETDPFAGPSSFRGLFPSGSAVYIEWKIKGGTFYRTAAANGMPHSEAGTTAYSEIFRSSIEPPYNFDKEIGTYTETSATITIEIWVKWDSEVRPEYKMVSGEDEEELENTRMVKAKLKYKGKKYSLKINPSKSKLEFIADIIGSLIKKIKISFSEKETLCEDLGVFTPTPSSINEVKLVNETCTSKTLELDIKPTNDFCQPYPTKYIWEKKTNFGLYQKFAETFSTSIVVSNLSPDLPYSFRVTPVVKYTYRPFPLPQPLQTLTIEGNSKTIDFPATDIQTDVIGPSTIESASGRGPIPAGGGVYDLVVRGNATPTNVSWSVNPPQYEQYIQEITSTSVLFSPVLPAGADEARVVISVSGEINGNCDPGFRASKSIIIVRGFDGLLNEDEPDQNNEVGSSQSRGMNESANSNKSISANSPQIAIIKQAHLQDQFSFAPNPSNGNLTIQFSFPDLVQTAEAVVFDLNGSLVFRVELQGTSGTQSIDLNVLNNGVYVLGLRHKDGALLSQFERLVIQR